MNHLQHVAAEFETVLKSLKEVDDRFDASLEPVSSKPPLVLFAGTIKAGKSTLLNELVSTRVLPDDKSVTLTRAYGRLVHRSTPTAEAVLNDGTREPISMERARLLLAKGAGRDPLQDFIDRVEIGLDHPLTRAVELEDAPGVDDVGAAEGGVPQDFDERAANATCVVYCIAGTVLISQQDARRLAALTAAGVPWLVAFTRFDEVDPDEEDDEPRQARLLSLARWNLIPPAGRVHFVSSYEHRHGDVSESGIDGLMDAIIRDASRPELDEARHLRHLNAQIQEASQVATELAMEIESEVTRDQERGELDSIRARMNADKELHALLAEFRSALQLANDDLLRKVRAHCAERTGGLAAPYETSWSPEWSRQVQAAATNFDAALGSRCERDGFPSPAQLGSVGAPAVAFPSLPVNIKDKLAKELVRMVKDAAANTPRRFQRLLTKKQDATGNGDVGEALAPVGAELARLWQRQRWSQRCANAADTAIHQATGQLLLAGQRRVTGAADLGYAVAQDEMDQIVEEGRKAIANIRDSVARLDTLGQTALRRARILTA